MEAVASRKSPRRFHLVLAFSLAAAGMLLLWWFLGRPWLLSAWAASWLVAINVVALIYFGYDKAQATQSGPRVPEAVLHALTAAGGSPGALLAMQLFRHKTMKGRFRILFWCIVALQATLLAWVIWLV